MKNLRDKVPQRPLLRFTFFVFAGVLLCNFLIPDFIYHQVWIILVFFFLLTLGSLMAIERVSKKKPDNFLGVYFSAMIVRLFISIIFATVFILVDRSRVFNFSINFLLLYLLFLGFEIYGIITNLRHQNKKGTGDE